MKKLNFLLLLGISATTITTQHIFATVESTTQTETTTVATSSPIPDPAQTTTSADPVPVDPVAINIEPDITSPSGSSNEEKKEEDTLMDNTPATPIIMTLNASPVTITPTRIRASQLRSMLEKNQISYSIINAQLKEKLAKKSTATAKSQDITTQMLALFASDPYLKVRKNIFSKMKNNGLSAAQKTLYETSGVTSALALFAESMPLAKKQYADILIQAFTKNPDPNVKMAPINYQVIMGDSRIPPFKANKQKDKQQKEDKQKQKDNKKKK